MFKKYPYLYEIPVLYFILYALNWSLLPEIPGYVGINPHPYWIGVLLFGFRYGLVAGLVSGFVSSLLYLNQVWFYGERYLFEDLVFYLLPSFFIIVGALMGIGVGRYRQRIFNLEDTTHHLQENASQFHEEVTFLKEVNQALEKKIVTRMTTLITLYSGAQKLESINLRELYAHILGFITKTLEAEESALYLKKNGGWHLHESIGWQDYEKRPRQIAVNEGLTGIAGEDGRVVTIRDFLVTGERSKETIDVLGDTLMAGPLRQGEKGDVVAVVSIQSIPFVKFNSATVNLFTFLLNWASRAIGRATYVTEMQQGEVIDPEYQVYSYSYFLSRFRQELARSNKYYLPLSLALIHVQGIDQLESRRKSFSLTAICQLLKSSVRDLDVVARFNEADIPFALLLMTASQAQAEGIKKTILENLMNLGLELPDGKKCKIAIRVGLSSFTPQMREMVDLLTAAREGTHA